MNIRSGESVYITVRSGGVLLFTDLVLIAPKMIFQKFKKVVHLPFIIITAIIMVKFCRGIMLHKWTKTGIRKVFRLNCECIKNLLKLGSRRQTQFYLKRVWRGNPLSTWQFIIPSSLVRAVGEREVKSGCRIHSQFRSVRNRIKVRCLPTKAQPFWMLKLSIVTSCQGSAFRGAEAVHCNFRPSFSLLSLGVSPLFSSSLLSLAMFIYLFSLLFPLPLPPSLSLCNHVLQICGSDCLRLTALCEC